MNQPPLNPDAFDAAWEALYEAFSGRIGDLNGIDCERMAETAIQAYLASALQEVTNVEPQEHYLCVCGKYITLTKAGVFRHHRGKEKEYPGSPWSKVCEGAGKKP